MNVIVTVKDDFDLDKIYDSGQVFTWKKFDSQDYKILDGGCSIRVSKKSDTAIQFEYFNSYWKNYFDLDTNYEEIRYLVKEPYMKKITDFGKGIRILRQHPFQTVVAFIISQQNNISRIRNTMHNLYALSPYINSFYKPHQLLKLDLKQLKIGYREKYIKNACEVFDEKIVNLSNDELFQFLIGIKGIGPKVAHCIMLYAYHRLDSFPEDVWIKRFLNKFDYNKEIYKPLNGVFQQYIFYYIQKHKDLFKGEQNEFSYSKN